MNSIHNMTAIALTARSQPAMPVPMDAPWNGFASVGIALQYDRDLARGDAI